MLKKAFSLFALAFLMLTLVGCNAPTRLNVTVELDPAMKQQLISYGNRSIAVDFVAVNANEHKRWENYSMSKYWTDGDDLRKSPNVKTMVLDPNKTPSVTLSAKDAIWNQWFANTSSKDVMRLYVLAQLPNLVDDKDSDSDPRRQILPLARNRWASTDVKLEVRKTGIIVITSPKEK